MIICERYSLVFIESSRTGSTAISNELIENYGGKKILRKHSSYHDYLKHFSSSKEMFFFSTVRNPMETVRSGYYKKKNNHKGHFTNSRKRPRGIRQHWNRCYGRLVYRFIQSQNASFSNYLKVFFWLPYTDWSIVSFNHLDYVMKYESLEKDFFKVLEINNIIPVRPLPIMNVTGAKNTFEDDYTIENSIRSHYLFYPFMIHWGYQIPNVWRSKLLSSISTRLFRLVNIFNLLYYRFLRS